MSKTITCKCHAEQSRDPVAPETWNLPDASMAMPAQLLEGPGLAPVLSGVLERLRRLAFRAV